LTYSLVVDDAGYLRILVDTKRNKFNVGIKKIVIQPLVTSISELYTSKGQ
jgi:hypothetical protein